MNLQKIKVGKRIWIFIVLIIAPIILIFIINKKNPIADIQNDKSKLESFFKVIEKELRIHPEVSLKYLDSADIIAKKIEDDTSKARVLIYKAEFEMINKGNVLQANKYIDQALIITKKINNEEILALLKNVQANCYFSEGKYVNAFSLCNEALQYFERKKDKKHVINIYNNLGLIYMGLKQTNQAIEYFNKALNLNKITKDIYTEYRIFSNLGSCYQNLKLYDISTNYLNKALKGFLQFNDSIGIFSTLTGIGYNSLNKNNDVKGACVYFNKAYQYANKINHKFMISNALNNMGNVYFIMNDLPKAKTYYEKSLKISQDEGYIEYETEALLSLYNIEKKLKNWEKALYLQTQYYETRDSFHNGDIQKKIAELQMQYQVEKKDYEFKLLQRKYDLKKAQNTILIISLSAFFIVAILIGIILILSNRNLQKNSRLKEQENVYLQQKIEAEKKIKNLQQLQHQSEIESKNRELATTTLQVISKNEIFSDLSDLADKFYSGKSMDIVSYNAFKRIIKENINLDKNWSQFKELFDKVHSDFFIKLKQRCPELTENELRMCSYIKINLQSKEIARILNINANSVRIFRYRLRKKLGLGPEVSLEDFIRFI